MISREVSSLEEDSESLLTCFGKLLQDRGARRVEAPVHNNKSPPTYLLLWVSGDSTFSLLDDTLCLSKSVSHVVCKTMSDQHTLVATEVFFAGAAFFLVTPTGLLALVTVVALVPFFGPLFAPVLAVALFFVAGTSTGASKILGLAFPVIAFSMRSEGKLRAEHQE